METARRLWRYHCATKHRPERYAPTPSALDWDERPDPFRRYVGADTVPLPLIDGTNGPSYNALFAAPQIPPTGQAGRGLCGDVPPDLNRLGLFMELAFGLSAWKQMGTDRWSLRNTPSSGNLHPTEVYLVLWDPEGFLGAPEALELERLIPGDAAQLAKNRANGSAIPLPGIYHYSPYDHTLERRLVLSVDTVEALVDGAGRGVFGLIGLSSVLSRESWKYGARGLRYCLHDVGHAVAAARFAAGTVGWSLRLDRSIAQQDIATMLGLDRCHPGSSRIPEPEVEQPDLVALIGSEPHQAVLPETVLVTAAQDSLWTGRASMTSAERETLDTLTEVLPEFNRRMAHLPVEDGLLPEPVIPGVSDDAVGAISPLPAARRSSEEAMARGTGGPASASETAQSLTDDTSGAPSALPLSAAALIRQRRSAQRMDAKTAMDRDSFARLCERLMPFADRPPFDALGGPPRVHLVFFVHRVEGLEPGIYLLCRHGDDLNSLRQILQGGGSVPGLKLETEPFDWTPVPNVHEGLHRLTMLDLTRGASKLFCRQGLGGRGAFSVAMIGAFAEALYREGAEGYAALHREAGAIGQLLYLEAEASGLRGTGLGCFLDDAIHDLLGIPAGETSGSLPPWQMLYGFSIGGEVRDDRLGSEPAYAHLGDRGEPLKR
ncbi:MAG: nitroreductase family protein [Rhodospirillaceae bacterium]